MDNNGFGSRWPRDPAVHPAVFQALPLVTPCSFPLLDRLIQACLPLLKRPPARAMPWRSGIPANTCKCKAWQEQKAPLESLWCPEERSPPHWIPRTQQSPMVRRGDCWQASPVCYSITFPPLYQGHQLSSAPPTLPQQTDSCRKGLLSVTAPSLIP